MSKRVFLIRHGQAEHNVLWEEDIDAACQIRDPKLTEKGRGQAGNLRNDVILKKALAAKPQVCIVSPMTRTLETATIGLEGLGIPFVACEHFQECASLPCDTGKPLEEIEPSFGMVDFSKCPANWYEKRGHFDFQTKKFDEQGLADLKVRMGKATQYLGDRPEDLIIVSAHHTVYCHLIGIEFANCEVVEMSLAPATEGGAWQDRWSVADSDGEMIPLYQEDGARATWSGSGELTGSIKTWSGRFPAAGKVTADKHAASKK